MNILFIFLISSLSHANLATPETVVTLSLSDFEIQIKNPISKPNTSLPKDYAKKFLVKINSLRPYMENCMKGDDELSGEFSFNTSWKLKGDGSVESLVFNYGPPRFLDFENCIHGLFISQDYPKYKSEKNVEIDLPISLRKAGVAL